MSIGRAVVHLWRLELEPHVTAEVTAHLDARERARAQRLVDRETKSRFVHHHGLLRAVLARHLNCVPGDIAIETAASGKPFLADQADCRFNMAHSGGYLALALSTDADVGVDIEVLRPVPDAVRIAERFFAPDDARLVAKSRESKRGVAFLTCWTRLEALLKCHGAGLRRGLNAVATGPEDNWPRQTTFRLDGREFALRTLNELPDFCLAVAAESSSITIRRESFPA